MGIQMQSYPNPTSISCQLLDCKPHTTYIRRVTRLLRHLIIVHVLSHLEQYADHIVCDMCTEILFTKQCCAERKT